VTESIHTVGDFLHWIFTDLSTSPKVLTASITRLHRKARHSRAALRLETEPSARLGSGSGRSMHLGTRLRSHRHGIDMSIVHQQAKLRAEKLGVAISQVHPGDAAGFVRREGRCGSLSRCHVDRRGSRRHHRASGAEPPPRRDILIGEPYWRQLPRRKMLPGGVCRAQSPISPASRTSRVFRPLARRRGMVLADQDSWDRYEAAKWLTMRRWLEANPDRVRERVRAKTSEPSATLRYTVNTWAGRGRADDAVMRGLPGDSESGENPIMPNKSFKADADSRAA